MEASAIFPIPRFPDDRATFHVRQQIQYARMRASDHL
jgi:hypothetical protein